MNVSIIIPCLNEESNIEPCLHSLLNQTYSPAKYEIIVVDGGSMDRTQDIVRKVKKKHPNVHLVVELKKGTATGRNAGLQRSKHNHVALIDADCEAPSTWLDTLVQHFKNATQQDKMIVGVGGSNIPSENTSDFIKAIGIALDSYLGSFSSVQGRRFKNSIYVPSLATLNALYDKQRIVEIGYFDESLGSEAEDADLNFRLISSGYKLYFVPDSFVWHKMRATPFMWLKNMFRYGKGRARLLKRYPQMWEVCYLLPLLFITFMSTLLLVPFSNFFLVTLFYFPVLFGYSLLQCIKMKSFHLVFQVMVVYIAQHIGYAAGEVYGLINPNIK